MHFPIQIRRGLNMWYSVRKISLFGLIATMLMVAACNQKPSPSRVVGKGGRIYGGTFKVSETERIQTLFPIAITDAVSAFVAHQIYQGLVKFSTHGLAVCPDLAERWEVDSTHTKYTFHLKKGLKFQDDACFEKGQGREIKAADVKYSIELGCTARSENVNFPMLFKNTLLGADDYYEETRKGNAKATLKGVKVLDDYTLELTLQKPSASFLLILATPAASIIPQEAVNKYGNLAHVGSGPFTYQGEDKTTGTIVLLKNPIYNERDSLGNALPFLDSIVVNILPTKEAQLASFQSEKLDVLLGLPSESVRAIVEEQINQFNNKNREYILERTPEMGTNYYEFNLTRPPFDDIKVRKAFSYAIDRNKIIDEVLKGEAYGPGVFGICPPSFKDYDITRIAGYDFNPDMANRLFYESGYKDKKVFPHVKMELNSGGEKNIKVASEIQKQLMEVLGIKVDFEVKPMAQVIEDSQLAKADMLRSGWIADYPDPENFLSLFYGANVPKSAAFRSYPNTTRYKNVEFDKLFEQGQRALHSEESYRFYAQAEQVMMNDAPVLMLWYDENYRLVKSRVKNLPSNPMRCHDCSQVYLEEIKKETIHKK